MADLDAPTPVDTEQQFWDELGSAVSTPCESYELIDDALRTWLYLVSGCRDQYLQCEDDVAACSQRLLDSDIFFHNREYVRTQIIYSLLQEDEYAPLHVIANFLLLDGRSDQATFSRMVNAGCFPRLLDLVKGCRDQDRRLHRLLLELMYEMSRIEHLRADDLMQVDDGFIAYLFELIEAYSDDADDPYHYAIIRVLLVLNEQYMVAATTAAADTAFPAAPLTNRVVKVLSVHGPQFKTFGENLILLLNRETETALQLLILKLLYLLFTTEPTYEYFYTNDLRVLLDVIIRNLLDLPNELRSLRHTYLRVMSPLLAHTQLNQPPHYKREEILKLLRILAGSGGAHFAPADETTLRLVDRVAQVPWLAEGSSIGGKVVADRLLGAGKPHSQSASNASVVDVAAVTERPGVKTPSRKKDGCAPDVKHLPMPGAAANAGEGAEIRIETDPARPRRALPQVPEHRHGKLTASQATPTQPNGNGQRRGPPPKAPPPRRKARPKPALETTESLVMSETLRSIS